MDEANIQRIGTHLNERFRHIVAITNLDQQKKAHYLSPHYLIKGGRSDDIAKKICAIYKTMESLEAATDDDLGYYAKSDVELNNFKQIKEQITSQLQKLRKGGKHGEQSSESG